MLGALSLFLLRLQLFSLPLVVIVAFSLRALHGRELLAVLLADILKSLEPGPLRGVAAATGEEETRHQAEDNRVKASSAHRHSLKPVMGDGSREAITK